MIILGDSNATAIKYLIDNENTLDCAVAFIGHKALELLKNKQLRLICNLESGATNPFVIEELIKIKGVEIKTHSSLHAKVYIGHNQAIISSANLSANGLSLEDEEIKGWLEAGYKINAKEEVADLKMWFKDEWEKAKKIGGKDIADAKEKWVNRRLVRPIKETTHRSLLEALKNKKPALRDRNIYIVITREPMSKEARQEIDKLKTGGRYGSKIDGYENWPYLPLESCFIDIFIDSDDIATVHGLWLSPKRRMLANFLDEDKKQSTIFLCKEIDDYLGYELSKKDVQFLVGNAHKLLRKGDLADEAFYVCAMGACDIMLGRNRERDLVSELEQLFVKLSNEADKVCGLPVGSYIGDMKKKGVVQWASDLAGAQIRPDLIEWHPKGD